MQIHYAISSSTLFIALTFKQEGFLLCLSGLKLENIKKESSTDVSGTEGAGSTAAQQLEPKKTTQCTHQRCVVANVVKVEVKAGSRSEGRQ